MTLLSKVEKLLEPLVSFIDDKLATPLSASTTLQVSYFLPPGIQLNHAL